MLKKLVLNDNDFSNEAVSTVQEYIGMNVRIKHLEMERCFI